MWITLPLADSYKSNNIKTEYKYMNDLMIIYIKKIKQISKIKMLNFEPNIIVMVTTVFSLDLKLVNTCKQLLFSISIFHN